MDNSILKAIKHLVMFIISVLIPIALCIAGVVFVSKLFNVNYFVAFLICFGIICGFLLILKVILAIYDSFKKKKNKNNVININGVKKEE